MKARVFISCGQVDDERVVALQIADELSELGLETYVATRINSIFEINSDIIRQLKNSDYYLFANFKREELLDRDGKPTGKFRGSLFSNQELAIAYALSFERMLIVNQEGVQNEGMLAYFGINTDRFKSYVEGKGRLRSSYCLDSSSDSSQAAVPRLRSG